LAIDLVALICFKSKDPVRLSASCSIFAVIMSHNNTRSICAYIIPFILYVVPSTFESVGLLGLNYEAVCAMKGVFAGAAVWLCWREYPAFSTVGHLQAIVVGVLGFAVWILLDQVQSMLPGAQHFATWLLPGNRVGYNPYTRSGSIEIRTAFVIIRLIELTIIVPVVEEIFWRGFLARYVITEDFQTVPQGVFTAFSFLVVTVAFASVHPEVLAAIGWGVMVNLLYVKTGNIWACVVMHSITNGLLGGYILATRSWQLW
jgi:CAAX prenyl protease-like protein